MKRPVKKTPDTTFWFALTILLFAAACEQPAGTGGAARVTLGSAADLAKIGKDAAYPLDGNYTLGANLTLTGWEPIGTYGARFTGTFDGGGRTLTISGSGGLFAFTNGAVIQYLTVAGTITKTGDPGAAVYAGAIAGMAENTAISSCVSTADIIVEGHGHNSSAGGIAGNLRSNSTITGCSATGTITLRSGANEGLMLYAGGIAGYQGTGYAAAGSSDCVISRSYFSGSVTTEGGYPYAGGIAGYNYCGSIIRECYSQTGTITARGENIPYAGGIAGYNSRTAEGGSPPSLIENCYSSITVSAAATSKQALAGGITGANAADAAVRNCYALGAVSAVINSGSGADAGGSIGVPEAASAGGIAGAQYFKERVGPSIKNCAALNSSITGADSGGGAYNVRRIAGPENSGAGEETGERIWENNIANVTALAAGNSNVAPASNAAGPDGADCAPRPIQAAYTALGWDFTTVWEMGNDGYPVLQ
jgi:hypothetical protein